MSFSQTTVKVPLFAVKDRMVKVELRCDSEGLVTFHLITFLIKCYKSFFLVDIWFHQQKICNDNIPLQSS